VRAYRRVHVQAAKFTPWHWRLASKTFANRPQSTTVARPFVRRSAAK